MDNQKLYRMNVRALRRPVLASAIALALAAPAAQAIDLPMGEGWTGAIDTTISYGVSMRLEDPAVDLTGKARFNPLIGAQPNAAQRAAPGRFSVNSDDSSYNYPEDGDIFANTFKITSELSINYEDTWGAFARASYFYDFENADKDELTELARDKVGERFTMLDAFVFYNFDAGSGDGTARLGRQVVSWGESTFIQNGINIINPIDVSKLRVAGAELKEAFLPVDMIFASYNFNEQFSVEGLYLFEFEQTEPDPVGTYFATNDFATLGGTYAMLNFGLVPQPVLNPERFYDVCYGGQPSDNPVINTSAVLRAQACGAAIPRAEDRFPDDGGQYGLAFHYFSPELMNTEFGFFFMNYHSRLPLISGRALTSSAPSTARVFIEYPEDIKMYGVSFNTTLEGPGIALQGELSYKEDVPLQVDDVELLFLGLSPLNALIPNAFLRFQSQLGNIGPGTEFRGWERHEVSQFQVTATRLFPNSLGAQQLAAVLEIGATNVWDLPDPSVLRYQGDGTDTGGGGDVLSGSGRNPITQDKGFPTKFSWGYRLAMRADYNNAFGTSFNLSPRVAFNHDVQGITPGPG
ncbi:MAG TPA: DUF1302 domain-containing protein, partial [Xanthomonadales bacterium]|nr:DUF1302 domain-containing protein [Xanthomonadales bacterium]